METAIEQAIRAAGSQSGLARTLGIKPQAVQKWAATGRIPSERVIEVERATGVSRQLLRPDLYPEELAEKEPEPRAEVANG